MDAITDVLAKYRENGRPAQKTAIVERLLRDGFRFWSREDQVSNRIERTLATMADDLAMARAMQNALAFQATGEDEVAYQHYLAQVERLKGDGNVAE
jgi:predicted regulator of amino acid metabolism with ACT domain